MEMSRVTGRPPSLQSIVHTGRNFYKKMDALPMYEHCLEVVEKAREVKMIKGSVIRGNDIQTAWLHAIPAINMIFHPIEYEKMKGSRFALPPILHHEEIRRQIDLFCKIKELDRRGAPKKEYAEYLNNGDAPLAIMPIMTDFAVTHNDGKHMEAFISDEEHPLFRTYRSKAEIAESLKKEAIVGEGIYAKVAELFGHPTLAGDIFKHSFQINHENIHNYVLEKLAEERLQEKLDFTRNMVKELAKHIRATFKSLGFDVRVVPRMKKHEGKIMRKVRNKLSEIYAKSEYSKTMPLEEYVNKFVWDYDITHLNDLVAARVIIGKLGGREIDKMEQEDRQKAIKLAMDTIELNLKMLNTRPGINYHRHHEFKNNEKGYKAHHYDSEPLAGTNEDALRFEIQLKTEEWHRIAEEGGAAHCYYLGEEEDNKLVRMMARAYKEIIHVKNGNGGYMGQLELPMEK